MLEEGRVMAEQKKPAKKDAAPAEKQVSQEEQLDWHGISALIRLGLARISHDRINKNG